MMDDFEFDLVEGGTDYDFDVMGELGLRDPRCRTAFVKGWHRAVSGGMQPQAAAGACGLTNEEYAVSVGFLKRFRRRLRRGIRRGTRYIRRRVSRAAKAAVRLARKGLKFAWRIVRKFIFKVAMPIARAICRVPGWILRKGAKAAGISTRYIRPFCKAVKTRNMNQIRRLLPLIMAIGAKIAAQGAFPPVAAAMRVIRKVPKQIRRLMVRFFPKRVRGIAKVVLAGYTVRDTTGAFFPPTRVTPYRPIDTGISPASAGWAF